MKTQDLRTLRFALIVATLLLALSSLGLTQNTATSTAVSVPRLIKFSGVVKDEAGAPKTGVLGITFAFYKDQQGGTPLWLETQNVQADANGRYAVMLGATKSDGLPMEFFSSNEARWVGVQPQGQNEQPRVLLVSAPYALKAADAETLGGKPLSAFQLAAPQSTNSSTKTALPPEQANEIRCAGGAACKTGFFPKFSSNGGSATVNDSIITQSGTTVGIAGNLSLSGNVNASTGQVLGQTGSFTANTSGTVLTVGNQNASGVAVLGVNENTNGNGVGVQGNGPNGVVGNGTTRGVTGVGGTIGVEGEATGTNSIGVSGTGSTGVLATGANIGVKATGGIAVWGEAPSTNSLGVLGSGGTGVFGSSQQTGDNFWGMMGTATNSGKNIGVEGFSSSPNGTGLYGLAISASHIGGGRGCCPVGVWGDTGSNAGGAAGLVGTADDARAIYLENNSPSGVPTAFMQQDASGELALMAGGAGGFCTINTNGTLFCPHALSVMAPVDSGKKRVALYAMESPQNWFEDFGSGQLTGGTARIALDATFAEEVNTGVSYHVFLTPHEECEGLYVTNVSASGFEVHELRHGQSNATFDYRIVALRRGFETVRSEDMTGQWKKMNALSKITPEQGIKPPSIPRVIHKSDTNPLPKLSAQR
jgi:hypothetical protein